MLYKKVHGPAVEVAGIGVPVGNLAAASAAAAQTFDRGEANAFDTLDAIAVAIDGYRMASCAAREAA